MNSRRLFFLIAACVCFVFPGEIIRYILLRDGVEVFRGLDTEFTDDRNVLPYRTYSYILSACTTAGCTNSPVVSVVVTEMACHTEHTATFSLPASPLVIPTVLW